MSVAFLPEPQRPGLADKFPPATRSPTLLAEERLGVANGNAKIRAPKATQDSERDADYFALLINQGTTGTARSGLCVEHNFVRQHIADMPLRDQGADQVAPREFVKHFRNISFAAGEDLLRGLLVGAREQSSKSRGVAH